MSLLYKPLESITAADLEALISNQVGENLYLEYKTEVFDKQNVKKRLQFLGSVSAFANAAGGDLLVGVKAKNGLPVDLSGLDPADIDSEMLRIHQVVGTSIEPHLVLHFHPVPLPTGRSVLIIRVLRSWTAPHGIEHNGHYQFFQRHAAGRSPMTLPQLRAAFTFSGNIVEQMRRFRSERLAWITAAEGPWGYLGKPLAVVHLVPFAGAAETVNIDFSNSRNFRKLSPLPAQSDGYIKQGDLRYNLDGVVMREGTAWHTQFFRNGSVEYATTRFLEQTTNPPYLDAWAYQINILKVIRRFFELQRTFGVAPPVIVMLTILNVANFRLRISEGWLEPINNELSKHQIDRDQLFLPDVVFNDFDADLIATLKRTFDCVWNAAGMEKCYFYSSNGEWKIDPSWLDPPGV
jgi:hypothetical protein